MAARLLQDMRCREPEARPELVAELAARDEHEVAKD